MNKSMNNLIPNQKKIDINTESPGGEVIFEIKMAVLQLLWWKTRRGSRSL